MDIALQPTDASRAVVTITGRLDLTSARTFRAAVTQAIDNGTTKLVVDLSRATFIDSSGLGALLGAYRSAHDAHGELRLAAPLPQVHDILTLMRLDRVLPPYDTTDQALSGL
jgi:anti-sigma B factor antagonist